MYDKENSTREYLGERHRAIPRFLPISQSSNIGTSIVPRGVYIYIYIYIYTLDRTRISPLVPSSRQRGEIIFVLDWLSHCSHSSPLTHSRDIFFTANSFRCPNILHFFVRYTPDCFLFPPARFLRARERCSSGEKIFEGKYLEVGRRARVRGSSCRGLSSAFSSSFFPPTCSRKVYIRCMCVYAREDFRLLLQAVEETFLKDQLRLVSNLNIRRNLIYGNLI